MDGRMDDIAASSPQEERVVGIHVMGPSAADVVQGFAVAMKCGLTKRRLDATVGVRPGSAQVSDPSVATRRRAAPVASPVAQYAVGVAAILIGCHLP